MINIGSKIIHPQHGEMTVVELSGNYEEFTDGKWRKGFRITADFDKFIETITWKNKKGNSRLIFHSYYLKNLEVK